MRTEANQLPKAVMVAAMEAHRHEVPVLLASACQKGVTCVLRIKN